MKKRTALTEKGVEKLTPPGAGRKDHFDALTLGFGVRVSANGFKSYFVITRLKTGKQVRITIGSHAVWNVGDARKRAGALLQEVALGKDPTAKPEPPPAVNTVAMVCADFINRYAKPKNRSWKGAESMLANHILPALGDRDIKSIVRADVRKLLANLTGKRGAPITGPGVNRVLSLIRRLFGWAVEEEYMDHSPVEGTKAPAEETERDRVLSDADLVRVWRATEAMGGAAGAYLRLLILTGQRRSEAATMKWADIDFGKAVWTLPREKVKGDRSHDVPLSPQAMTVIGSMPRIGTSPFVFTGRGNVRDVPVSGFSKIKAAIDDVMAKDGKAIAPWRLHDLRRTAGTGMARLGVPVVTISRVLNHAEGGVTKIYVRYGFLDEKRAALEKWANHIEKLVDPAKERDNVVPFAAA
jgi:integrase